MCIQTYDSIFQLKDSSDRKVVGGSIPARGCGPQPCLMLLRQAALEAGEAGGQPGQVAFPREGRTIGPWGHGDQMLGQEMDHI